MLLMGHFFVLAALLARLALALPAPVMPITFRARDDNATTPVTKDQLAAFTSFTQFARAAYCPSDKLTDWKCGGEFGRYRLNKMLNEA
jgi:hypothetical protein